MQHIFSCSGTRRRDVRLVSGAVATMLVAAIYVAAAARPFPQQPNSDFQALGVNPTRVPTDDAEAAQMKAQLAGHPDNVSLRAALLVYYMSHYERSEYINQLLWIIQHHPEARVAGFGTLSTQGGPLNTPEDYLLVAAAWQQAVREHGDSANVLFNAGVFFERTDPEHALDLLQRAKQLDSSSRSERYVQQIATIYAGALSTDTNVGYFSPSVSPNVAPKLAYELETSTDPALLSAAGERLVEIGTRRDNVSLVQKGYELLGRAIDFDPGNPKWKDALESAKYNLVRQQNYREMSRTGGPTAPVRIGAGVAESNLITKVAPEYPPLALSARIQGDVSFTVTIGPDGHVQSMQLVRGHPLLAQAAAKALTQYVYRPTLLNGQPAAVITDVTVTFKLP